MVVQTAADTIALEDRRSSWWKTWRPGFILAGFGLLFIILVCIPILSDPAQNNCLAIFVLASLLWSSEVIPLFVTSMLVPLLVIVFQTDSIVLVDSDKRQRLNAEDAAKHVFSVMFSSTIMLLLGGFAIAAALSKVHQ